MFASIQVLTQSLSTLRNSTSHSSPGQGIHNNNDYLIFQVFLRYSSTHQPEAQGLMKVPYVCFSSRDQNPSNHSTVCRIPISKDEWSRRTIGLKAPIHP